MNELVIIDSGVEVVNTEKTLIFNVFILLFDNLNF